MRDYKCKKYGDCLDSAAKEGREFDCVGCIDFLKWRELKMVRESRSPERKEAMEEKEVKQCEQCKAGFEPKRSDSRFCSKVCSDKWFREHRTKKNIPHKKPEGKKIMVSPPSITEGITLDAQLLRAVKKSAVLDFVKNELPKMVEERFA